jgi:hypothetical protein
MPSTRRHRHHLRRPLRHAAGAIKTSSTSPAVKGFSLGYDNVDIVTPDDVWRSSLYDRMNVVNPTIQMPPLARNLIDTNAVESWPIGSTACPARRRCRRPPSLRTAGLFTGFVSVTRCRTPAPTWTLYYTLDGSLPTTNSTLIHRTDPVVTNSATVNANAWESGLQLTASWARRSSRSCPGLLHFGGLDSPMGCSKCPSPARSAPTTCKSVFAEWSAASQHPLRHRPLLSRAATALGEAGMFMGRFCFNARFFEGLGLARRIKDRK